MATPKPSPRRIKRVFSIRPDLLEELRDAVAFLGVRMTDVVDAALRAELAKLRRRHMKGRGFPKRERDAPGE